MKKKVLMVCTTASMIGNFNLPNIALLQEKGFDVEVACNFKNGSNWTNEDSGKLKIYLTNKGVKYYQIEFARSPYNLFNNVNAYKSLNRIIRNNDYFFVHCQTPVGAVITRLVTSRIDVPVIYTAHGFHFFKGAPKKNWLFYYPVEKWLSKYVDILITINDEDFALAREKMNADKVCEIPGAGVVTSKFHKNEAYRKQIRQQLNISDKKILVFSVGELNDNKNHQVIIKALNLMRNKNIVYVIAGVGSNKNKLNLLARKYGLSEQVKLIGYKDDIEKYYSAADIFAFPSKREGLSFAGVEAMSAGLPIVGSNVRGVKDYVYNGKSGFLLKPTDVEGFAKRIQQLAEDNKLRKKMGEFNIQAAKKYDISNVKEVMKKIYLSI